MEWQVILALVLAIPVILIPVAFIWYLNIGAIAQVEREARRKRKAAREEGVSAAVKVKVK